MHTMMRFGELVRNLLETCRSAALAADDWTKLSNTALNASEFDRKICDIGASCYLWSIASITRTETFIDFPRTQLSQIYFYTR